MDSLYKHALTLRSRNNPKVESGLVGIESLRSQSQITLHALGMQTTALQRKAAAEFARQGKLQGPERESWPRYKLGGLTRSNMSLT